LLATGCENTVLLWDLAGRSIPSDKPGQKLKPEQLERLWTDLQSPEAGRAFQAMTTLRRAPEQAVALFTERVKPAAGKTLDDKEIAAQIAALDDDRFAVREKASAALSREVRAARPARVRALADHPSPEKKRRLEALLEKLKGDFPAPESLRCLRAVEVLQWLGTPAARGLLKTLASGRPDDRLTKDAAAVLQRSQEDR
jgi:hypothetical protein